MATITFDQATLSPAGIVDRSRSDGLIDGSEVTITVDEPGVVTFVDVPEGDIDSVASLTETAPQTWKFTPTAGVYGSWLVQFQPSAVNASPVRRVFAVRSPKKALRIPAFNERSSIEANVANGSSFVDVSDDNEGENYRGWARSLSELYRTVSDLNAPLTTNVTVYVDNAAGNDANAGTQAAPFKTFARAWQERQKYGVLRAKFTIQLLGVGPYTMPTRLGPSVADVSMGGYLIIRGDDSVEVVHATGSFTGDWPTNSPTIGTSAGLGVDTHKHRFCRVTSGPATGCVFLIAKNIDDSITAVERRFKASGSFTITAGTTFTIFTPGTKLAASAVVRVEEWIGGDALALLEQGHVFVNLALVGPSGMNIHNSQVTFVACNCVGVSVTRSVVNTTWAADGAILGMPTHAYRSAAITITGGSHYFSYFAGPFSVSSTGAITISYSSLVEHHGGRVGGSISVYRGGCYALAGPGSNAFRFEGGLLVADPTSSIIFGQASVGLAEWAVVTGSCVRASRFGSIDWQPLTGAGVTGGTTDPAGFGVDVSGGGRCVFVNQAPTLTGGTPGKDLKTTNNGGQPNSILASGGVLDDQQYVEVAKTETLVASRKQLNLIEGGSVTLTVADNPTSDRTDITIGSSALSALTTDRIIYVDSVGGNDANAGTQAAPFKTLDRAWAERQKYGVLYARFKIQLLGAGPYSVSGSLGASVCGTNGYLIIQGDTAAETSHATGTFTGDFGASDTVIGTSAGLGTDTHKHRWVRITSGACNGVEFSILENTDTSITAVSKRFRTLMPAVAAGDTFKIFTPGTVVTAFAFESWIGGTNPVSVDIRHVFHRISFTGTMAPNFCQVTFPTCRGGSLQMVASYVCSFLVNAVAVFGDAPNANIYRSAAAVTGSISMFNQAYAYGPFSVESAFSIGSRSTLEWIGGRCSPAYVNVYGGGLLNVSVSGTTAVAYRFDGYVQADYTGRVIFNTGAAMYKWATSSGSCVLARRGGMVQWMISATGGTTDPAGYGIEVRGGQVWLTTAPTLTGGTSGKDLKTSNNGGVPNSTLSATGTTAGTAADALLGEVLARVS